MKLQTILDKIEAQSMALPEFQRGYVWKRVQVRNFFLSLYRQNPVGSLLVWETSSEGAIVRGGGTRPPGVIQLLLDGQQRITSAYGVICGKAPAFFDGDAQAFSGLHFHVDQESFEFYQPSKMASDPLWVSVSRLMKDNLSPFFQIMENLDRATANQRLERLNALHQIKESDIHIDQITAKTRTGRARSADDVVEIFNVVNSGGTKLSKGDLVLAKICAHWPEARTEMKERLSQWRQNGYFFTLDWLLRSLNTVLTGEADFRHLHGREPSDIQSGLSRAVKGIDSALNLIDGRLGLDHDRVLFGKFAIPVMAHYFDRQKSTPRREESDKMLFWYLQAAMWGRFSGSTVTTIDQDLEALGRDGLDGLLERMRLWRGNLRVQPAHFEGWRISDRFYPILYLLTRMGSAQNLCDGLPLKRGLLGGTMAKLEVHHIFPKARLRKHGYKKYAVVNSLANLCFLTKDCNLRIGARLPQDYLSQVMDEQPDALESQWIPTDQQLWRMENYPEFLEARRALLAEETNKRLDGLLHGDTQWIREDPPLTAVVRPTVIGGITSEEEAQELDDLNAWVVARDLAPGVLSSVVLDPTTDEPKAVLDLAWPDGIQTGLSHPVAVLLGEGDELLRLANDAGYRFFTSVASFKRYVKTEILRGEEPTSSTAETADGNQ